MMHDTDAYGTCTGPILLDDVQCVGDEQNLGECVMSNFGEHNCDHKEDVGCKCDPNSTPSGKEGLNSYFLPRGDPGWGLLMEPPGNE